MLYPEAIGPYSAYKIVGDLVFCSGQIPINPQNGKIESDDIKDQTKQVLKNIQGILTELKIDFKNVVKSLVFLTDIDDFVVVNEIYGEFFQKPFPARSAVAVKSLPKGAKIEIEVIASLK